jgi:hypothetical protein
MVKKVLFSLSVSVAFAEYSVLAKYAAEYTSETFGRRHFRSDTIVYIWSGTLRELLHSAAIIKEGKKGR